MKSLLHPLSKLRIIRGVKDAKRIAPLITTTIVAILLIAVGVLPRGASAFQTFDIPNPFDPDDPFSQPAHYWIADRALGDLIRPEILDDIKHQNAVQDWNYSGYPSHHFLRSTFNESASYINERYAKILNYVSHKNLYRSTYENPAQEFGLLIHTAQDFYAHSNWVDIFVSRCYYASDNDMTTPDRPSAYFLYEPGLGFWFSPISDWYMYPYRPVPPYYTINGDAYYVDIMIAQTSDPYYVPYYRVDFEYHFPFVPSIVASEWVRYDALMTTAGGCTPKLIEVEHDILAKDTPSDSFYEDAFWNAVAQTRHEFWRLLNLAKGSDYSGSSVILGYWLDPGQILIGPAPAPVTVTVWIDSLSVSTYDISKSELGPLGFALVLYSGNFSRIVKSETSYVYPSDQGNIPYDGWPAPLTLSFDPTDTLVVALEPWTDSAPGGGFNVWADNPITDVILCFNVSDLRSGTYDISDCETPSFNRYIKIGLDVELTFSITAPPVAEAGGPYVRYEGERFTLSAGDSSDFDGIITDYEWDLDGDGQYDDATGMEPDYTWVDEFEGTIGLKVTNDDGLSAYDTANVTIENVDPCVEKGVDVVICLGELATVTGNYTDPGLGDTHSFEINWGDGSNSTGQAERRATALIDGLKPRRIRASGGSINMTHLYSEAGTFQVELTVRDNDGGFDSIHLCNVKVMTAQEGAEALQPPVASFTFSPRSISPNHEIDFDASQSSDVDGEIVSYEWDFGDGNATSGSTVAHTYSVPGEYAVSLVVVDNDGLVSTRAKVIHVRGMQPPPPWIWVTTIIAVGGAVALAVRILRARRAVKP